MSFKATCFQYVIEIPRRYSPNNRLKEDSMSFITPVAILVLVIFFLSTALRVLNEYERGVIFRLGRVIAAKGPGLIILIPLIDKIVKVSLINNRVICGYCPISGNLGQSRIFT